MGKIRVILFKGGVKWRWEWYIVLKRKLCLGNTFNSKKSNESLKLLTIFWQGLPTWESRGNFLRSIIHLWGKWSCWSNNKPISIMMTTLTIAVNNSFTVLDYTLQPRWVVGNKKLVLSEQSLWTWNCFFFPSVFVPCHVVSFFKQLNIMCVPFNEPEHFLCC